MLLLRILKDDLYHDCDSGFMHRDQRLSRLDKEIQTVDPDVLCLQVRRSEKQDQVRGSNNKYVDLSCLRLCSIAYIIASELRQMVSKTQWTEVDPRHGKSAYLL